MNLFTLNFLLFFLLVVTVYYLLPRRPQNVWLLLASYAFCITWSWRFALVLLFVTGANYLLAHRVYQPAKAGRRTGRAWLWLAIGLNLLALGGFRLAGFYVADLQQVLTSLGLASPEGTLRILLPIGLSYYILENIAYQVDVYRGQIGAERDLIDFALYQAYFPKLLAGPIERAGTFLPRLARPRVVTQATLARGLTLVVTGLVRKLLVADILNAALPWDLFQAPENFWAPELLAWLVVFAFALYNDFAGYTDIVRGVSLFFGLELSPNFDRPYFARNFTEFWNRWHITLSHWLRDYIFFPLTRALLRRFPDRRHPANLLLPPLVTMLVSGLWHGFTLHMLFWGLLHAVYQIVERLSGLWRPVVPIQRRPWWRQSLAAGLVFLLVVLAWVPFQVELPAAFEVWQSLAGNWLNVGLRYRRLVLTLPYVLSVLALDWFQIRAQDEFVILRWPRLARSALLALATLLIILVSQGDPGAPFIYQGF